MARLAEGGITAASPRDAAEQAGFCNLAAGGEDCIGGCLPENPWQLVGLRSPSGSAHFQGPNTCRVTWSSAVRPWVRHQPDLSRRVTLIGCRC